MGLLLWFGLVQMPSLESYWSTKIRYKNNVASKIMSRNRFELLLRFWHFADNEETPENDRIYKVRDLLERVVKNYQNVMELDEYLAIDESMVPFRGRLKFKQYIPGKAHKYGVKLFKICEKNGYTHDLQVYAGKNQVDGKGLALRVVMGLIRPYLNVGRTVVTDNFYTSMPLARELLKNNTHLVGTLRTNRVKLPEVTNNWKRKYRWGSSGEMARQTRCCNVVYKHDIEMIDTGKKNRNDEPILKPQIIIDYNSGKAGIDLSDQLSSYNSPIRKSIRWCHKVATEILLGTSVFNAFIVYNMKKLPNEKISITKFREMLVDELLGLDQLTNISEEPSNSNNKRKRVKHVFEESVERDHRNRKIRKRCLHCYSHETTVLGSKSAALATKKVNTLCSTCKMYTCIDCFNKNHLCQCFISTNLFPNLTMQMICLL
ncbi:hypothetical protein AGLY_007382 [Aphis glycines]|uniref:PiggyBac transposable element-derived protein domain-containing protein n=1 Tax=Aphis glycines TaxID=307491 RepID=A0A6G0TP16_APHGL|nr:hypothetical protein AGLY_007382 [Aphis glycines]